MAEISCIQGNWSELPHELLELILKKLCYVDIVHFKAVSPSWCLAAKSYTSSPDYSALLKTPWFILSTNQRNKLRFFSLSDQREYNINNNNNNNMFEGIREQARCVGTSYEWLIFSDDKIAKLYLVNPFSGARIDQLPSTETLPDRGNNDNSSNGIGVVEKAILMSNPSRNKNILVVILYRDDRYFRDVGDARLGRIAFYRHGDGEENIINNNNNNKWTYLDVDLDVDNHRPFRNIACHNDRLYAFSLQIVEVWDFGNQIPTKVGDYYKPLSFPSTTYYVVSEGDIFHVLRLGQTWTSSTFYVTKLNYKNKNWDPVESLNGKALFLHDDQSILASASASSSSVDGCQENCIYFSDYDDKEGFGIGMYKYNLMTEVATEKRFDWDVHHHSPYWILPNI